MTTYGSLTLTVTSPVQSFTEPVGLVETKEALGVTIDNDDALLDSYIVASREVAESFQNKDLVEKQWDLALDAFWSPEIELRDLLVSVDLVKYRDSDGDWTTLAETTEYIYDTLKHPGVVMPAYGESWPSFTAWPSSAVLVRFTAGSTAIHTVVKAGMYQLMTGWYDRSIPFDLTAGLDSYPSQIAAMLSYGASPKIR